MEARAGAIPFSRELASRSVIVTGASGGIGAAVAVACARSGAARLLLLGRSPSALEAVSLTAEQAGSEVITRVCDVTNTLALAGALETVEEVDVLVNCAGANRPESFLDVSQDTFDWLWQLNVRAVFFASQRVAQHMIDRGRPGVIINISSQMGHVGAPLRSVYCATKHAIEGLTKALAVELAPHGIRVVSIAPTFVRTSMTAGQLDDPVIADALLAEIPLGRFSEPEDVAAAVVFAASGDAAFLTGSSLKLDGGWTAK